LEYNYRVNFLASKDPQMERKVSASGKIVDEDGLVMGYLNPGLREWCEKALSSFDFVRWDRFICTKTRNGPHVVTCYGWIDRKTDSYKDFLVVSLVLDSREALYSISSSAENNDRISELCARLSGFEKSANKQCIRVEDCFSIPNMVKIRGTKK
jgi:hypothetical protein